MNRMPLYLGVSSGRLECIALSLHVYMMESHWNKVGSMADCEGKAEFV